MVRSGNNAAATDAVWFKPDDTRMILTGMLVSNHCLTAVAARIDTNSAAAKRAAIGGILGTSNSCVKIAVDGYSLSGAMVVGKMTNDLTATGTDANNMLLVNEIKTQLNVATGNWTGDATTWSVNQGSPTVIM